VDAAQKGSLRGNGAREEVILDRLRAGSRCEAGELEQRLLLGGERDPVGGLGEAERFHSHPVARRGGPPAPVPEREREVAPEQVHAIVPEAPVQLEDHLGVARGAESLASPLQFLAKRAVLVNLAVEDDGELAFEVEHGLCAAWPVDHGEASVSEADRAVHVRALAVRPAVALRIGEGAHQRLLDGATGPPGMNGDDPAHAC
jgi:hypothetical protein